jgi:organic hydroperoxide reductase OsmC/OhrA
VSEVHRYVARCSWRGSTGEGYERYSREHAVTATPADAQLRLSADSAFQGDPTLLNPEQLVLMAASSCQLLSFLAVAARARIDVLEYDDNAEAMMPEDDRPMRITRITLRPHVVVVEGPSVERVEHLLEVAHRECFIASSLRSEITLEPTVEIRA